MDKRLLSKQKLQEIRRKKNWKRKLERLQQLGTETGIFEKGGYKKMKTQPKATVAKIDKTGSWKENLKVPEPLTTKTAKIKLLKMKMKPMKIDESLNRTEVPFDNLDIIRLSSINEQLVALPTNQE